MKQGESNLPTVKDFGGCLDAKAAWKHFGGLDLNSAYKLFCENPLCYQEDFMFMETKAFEFYFPVIDRFLREKITNDLFDDSEAWILGEAILSQLEFIVSRGLLEKISSLSNYVRSHLSQYSSLPAEQEEIDDAWLKIEQRVVGFNNPILKS